MTCYNALSMYYSYNGATIRSKRYRDEEELLENRETAHEHDDLLVAGKTVEMVYQRHNRLWKKTSEFDSTAIAPFPLHYSC